MKAEREHYPIFEANQVLSNRHLNDVFNYLDEQDRLTRANLIGIGIVCGLEIELKASPQPAIALSKGCGITSEGYLIVEPDDVELVSYRSYEIPSEVAYPLFGEYPLWELFPAGEPNTEGLDTPGDFLNDKAVVLFLELKKSPLRNCSPNNCDDKGSAVSVSVRRLLIRRDDLAGIVSAANALDNGMSVADLQQKLTARFKLPDLHLPAYDVPAASLLTSQQVLSAFFAAMNGSGLAAKTRDALSAAYQAFKPLLDTQYPNDPFGGFDAKFGFLNAQPNSPRQVRFLPYYYDFFDDLFAAYDEFRWQAAELVCLCCPPDGLFPRHLMLGLLFPEAVAEPEVFRNRFLPSPAVGGCTEPVREAQHLFDRLVEIVERFTNDPPLPADAGQHVKVTPSRLGHVPLSVKAIPHYYLQNGNPPLYRLWNPQLTQRGRAEQNLSYRAYEYTSLNFVLEPLRYDREACNFLRIEGHLGKPYQQVLESLLLQKRRFRLPIEVIALRTGEIDETVDIDLTKHACYFDDLITMYRALRREMLCAASKATSALATLKIGRDLSAVRRDSAPLTPAAAGEFQSDTLGALYAEKYQVRDFCDLVDIGEPPLMNAAIRTLGFLQQFDTLLADDIGAVDWSALDRQFLGLRQWTAEIARQRDAGDTIGELNWKAVDAVLVSTIDQCRSEALKLIQEELQRRIREVNKKRFLSDFLQKHPGIRHKAGVPLGGTFILVYHEQPKTNTARPVAVSAGSANAFTIDRSATAETAMSEALQRLRKDPNLAANRDFQIVLDGLSGRPFDAGVALPAQLNKLFDSVVDQLPDGAVIADFYLPYLCCSDCAPIQFVLPKSPPSFELEIGCTNPNNQAEVVVVPLSGKAPYRVQIDDGDYGPLNDEPLLLSVGAHSLRIKDSDESESPAKDIVITEPLRLVENSFKCTDGNYLSVVRIDGGTPPYRANGDVLTGNVFVSEPVASGSVLTVEVVDSKECSAGIEVVHVCEEGCGLPCDGQSRRCAYRLWLQPPSRDVPYEVFRLGGDFVRFRFDGKDFEIPVDKIFSGFDAARLNEDFGNTIAGAIKILNDLIRELLIQTFGDEGRGRFELSYDPNETEPFSVFRLTHFVCESFSLEFDFAYAKPSPVFEVSVRYTNEPSVDGNSFNGMILTDRRRNTEIRIPAFDCREANLCRGDEYQRLCKGPELRPIIEFEPTANNVMVFSGRIDRSQTADIVSWIWDFPNAVTELPAYTGEKTEVRFERVSGSARLTVITSDGCFYNTVRALQTIR